jgi:hypothetical protein
LNVKIFFNFNRLLECVHDLMKKKNCFFYSNLAIGLTIEVFIIESILQFKKQLTLLAHFLDFRHHSCRSIKRIPFKKMKTRKLSFSLFKACNAACCIVSYSKLNGSLELCEESDWKSGLEQIVKRSINE